MSLKRKAAGAIPRKYGSFEMICLACVCQLEPIDLDCREAIERENGVVATHNLPGAQRSLRGGMAPPSSSQPLHLAVTEPSLILNRVCSALIDLRSRRLTPPSDVRNYSGYSAFAVTKLPGAGSSDLYRPRFATLRGATISPLRPPSHSAQCGHHEPSCVVASARNPSAEGW